MRYLLRTNTSYEHLLLLLFYRDACKGWQPPMSKEDTKESPLAQKCYWHRIIPEVGGHFDPWTKQGTPTTRRRPPLVGLKECSQMHKRGWNYIEKKLLIVITTNSNSKSRLASSYSSQLRKSSGTRNTRKKSQQAWFPEGAASGRPILQDPKVKQLSTDSWPCRVPNNRLLRFAGWAASLFCPGEARGLRTSRKEIRAYVLMCVRRDGSEMAVCVRRVFVR